MARPVGAAEPALALRGLLPLALLGLGFEVEVFDVFFFGVGMIGSIRVGGRWGGGAAETAVWTRTAVLRKNTLWHADHLPREHIRPRRLAG